MISSKRELAYLLFGLSSFTSVLGFVTRNVFSWYAFAGLYLIASVVAITTIGEERDRYLIFLVGLGIGTALVFLFAELTYGTGYAYSFLCLEFLSLITCSLAALIGSIRGLYRSREP